VSSESSQDPSARLEEGSKHLAKSEPHWFMSGRLVRRRVQLADGGRGAEPADLAAPAAAAAAAGYLEAPAAAAGHLQAPAEAAGHLQAPAEAAGHLQAPAEAPAAAAGHLVAAAPQAWEDSPLPLPAAPDEPPRPPQLLQQLRVRLQKAKAQSYLQAWDSASRSWKLLIGVTAKQYAGHWELLRRVCSTIVPEAQGAGIVTIDVDCGYEELKQTLHDRKTRWLNQIWLKQREGFVVPPHCMWPRPV
jgi:hypothetical protein